MIFRCDIEHQRSDNPKSKRIRLAIEEENIESRPIWKPMHLQPAFKDCRVIASAVSEELFDKRLCLPSGSNLTDSDLERITDVIRRQCPYKS